MEQQTEGLLLRHHREGATGYQRCLVTVTRRVIGLQRPHVIPITISYVAKKYEQWPFCLMKLVISDFPHKKWAKPFRFRTRLLKCQGCEKAPFKCHTSSVNQPILWEKDHLSMWHNSEQRECISAKFTCICDRLLMYSWCFAFSLQSVAMVRTNGIVDPGAT